MPSRSAAFAPSTTAGYRAVAALRNEPVRTVPSTAASSSGSVATTPMPPVSSAGIRSVRRTVALTAVVPAAADDRADAADHRRGVLGQLRVVAEERLPGFTVSRLVPRPSSWSRRSARPDAEMPSTATRAAMPMAMPSAVERGAQPAGAQADGAGPDHVTRPGGGCGAAGARSAVVACRHPATARRSASSTMRPSSSETQRGSDADRAASWVMSTMVDPPRGGRGRRR